MLFLFGIFSILVHSLRYFLRQRQVGVSSGAAADSPVTDSLHFVMYRSRKLLIKQNIDEFDISEDISHLLREDLIGICEIIANSNLFPADLKYKIF